MDVSPKTLAQLSAEHRETKFVSLDTASQISGYTKESLERLCVMGKIDYRVRGVGKEKAVEIESLLRETHAILLSYDGVAFVEPETLSEPIEDREASRVGEDLEHVEAQARTVSGIPTFSQSSDTNGEGGTFARIGSAIVSDAATPSVFPESSEMVTTPSPSHSHVEHTEHEGVGVLEKGTPGLAPIVLRRDPVSVVRDEQRTSSRLPVFGHEALDGGFAEKSVDRTQSEGVAPYVVPHKPTSVRVVPDNGDDWDRMLFGGGADAHVAQEETLSRTRADQGPSDASVQLKEVPVSQRPSRSALPPPPPPPPPLTPSVISVVPGGATGGISIDVDQIILPPSRLPAPRQDTHPMLAEHHPLMSSVSFNAIFLGVLLAVGAFGVSVLTSHSFLKNDIRPDEQVAGVGGVFEAGDERQRVAEVPAPATSSLRLPFSDEVVVSAGSRPETVVVRPVFRSGQGKSYEFGIVPVQN
jgi:hypothetical protein